MMKRVKACSQRNEFDYLYDFRCAEESRCLDNRNEEILSGYRFRRSISDTLLGTLVEAAQRDHSYITQAYFGPFLTNPLTL